MYITTVIMSVFALLSSSASTTGNANANANVNDNDSDKHFYLDNFVLHDPSGEPGNYIKELNFDISDKPASANQTKTTTTTTVHCAASWDYRMDGYPRGYVPCNSTEWNWYISSWKNSSFELELLHIWDPENDMREYHHRFAHLAIEQDAGNCTYAGSGAASCDWGALDASVYNETVNALV